MTGSSCSASEGLRGAHQERRGTSHRIVANDFLSGGGDGFPAFTNGTGKWFGGPDIDGFAAYLPTVSPYSPASLDRITKQ